jgi:hypothetical protein
LCTKTIEDLSMKTMLVDREEKEARLVFNILQKMLKIVN